MVYYAGGTDWPVQLRGTRERWGLTMAGVYQLKLQERQLRAKSDPEAAERWSGLDIPELAVAVEGLLEYQAAM